MTNQPPNPEQMNRDMNIFLQILAQALATGKDFLFLGLAIDDHGHINGINYSAIHPENIKSFIAEIDKASELIHSENDKNGNKFGKSFDKFLKNSDGTITITLK